MKLSPFHFTAGVLAALALASGCRCGDTGPTTNTEAEFAATPAAVQFNACPTKDENGGAVPDVFPDEQIVTISNLGKVSGTIASLDITGGDPNVKTIFSIPADKIPTSVEGSGEVEVPVHFSPDKQGDINATLTINDGKDDTDDVKVNLIGNGINKPAQATVSMSFEVTAGQGDFQDCDPSVISSCTPTFPNTFFKETSKLKFKVVNLGCPTLKILGAEIKPSGLQQATQQAFAFGDGFVAPTAASPATLNSADDTSEFTFDINFAPVDETTNPSNPDDGQRYAILTVTTNDPVYPTLDIALVGLGVAPSAYATPTFCNFTDTNDACGNATRVPGNAKISIGNGGQQAIKVSSISFANGGRGGRFALSGTAAQGQTIAPGAVVVQEVSYTDAPTFVSDEMIISSVDAVNPAQSAGDVKITFYGGTLPCLSTEPNDVLSFEGPTTDLTVKDIVIKNGAGCGTLTVDEVGVDQPNPFFSVVDPKIPAGTQVVAGSSVTAKIQYKKPVAGGTQTGLVRIKTNDPAFADPFKVVTVYSNSPLNQIPYAKIKGPTGQTTQMTISRASIPLSNGKRQIQVLGTDSYDPTDTGTKPVAKYQFFMLRPSNATSGSIENTANAAESCNTGACSITITNDKILLTVDPVANGEYRISLIVYDDTNQKSTNTAVLKIQVND